MGQLEAKINGQALEVSDPRALVWTTSGCTTTQPPIMNITILYDTTTNQSVQHHDPPQIGISTKFVGTTHLVNMGLTMSVDSVGQVLFGSALRFGPTRNDYQYN